MTPVATETAVSPVAIKKTYKYYNDALELVSKEVEVSFTPATDAASAMNRLGNNEAVILKALNAQLQKLTISEGRKSAVTGGISKKILLNVIKPFRLLPPWSLMVDESLTGAAKGEAKRKQTASLLDMIRGNSVILEAIKTASAADVDEDEDDNDDESGE